MSAFFQTTTMIVSIPSVVILSCMRAVLRVVDEVEFRQWLAAQMPSPL